ATAQWAWTSRRWPARCAPALTRRSWYAASCSCTRARPRKPRPRPTRSGACQAAPGIDHRVRVERHRQDALVLEPLGEVRMVAGALAADTDVLAGVQAGADGPAQHELDRFVALVEVGRQQLHARIAVQAQGELG